MEDSEQRWTRSDKLAVALACIGAALALILFLVDKTPVTVGVMTTCIAALLAYPIQHFVPSRPVRISAIILMILLVCCFGWSRWPKNIQAPASSATAPPIPASSSPNAQPLVQPKSESSRQPKPIIKPQQLEKPQTTKLSTTPSTTTTISAPNGIAIGGGIVTNPTVNNYAPPIRVIASAQTQRETGDQEAPWETRFTISTNLMFQTGDLELKCNGPVLRAGISRINPASFTSGSNGPDASDPSTVVYQLGPEVLSPGRVVTIVVYSKEPVRVLSGTIGQQEIIF